MNESMFHACYLMMRANPKSSTVSLLRTTFISATHFINKYIAPIRYRDIPVYTARDESRKQYISSLNIDHVQGSPQRIACAPMTASG